MPTNFCLEYLKKSSRLEDLDIDGRVLLKAVLKNIMSGGVVWSHLAQDVDQCSVFVKMVMILRVP
jgi:hypothetical protein